MLRSGSVEVWAPKPLGSRQWCFVFISVFCHLREMCRLSLWQGFFNTIMGFNNTETEGKRYRKRKTAFIWDVGVESVDPKR